MHACLSIASFPGLSQFFSVNTLRLGEPGYEAMPIRELNKSDIPIS